MNQPPHDAHGACAYRWRAVAELSPVARWSCAGGGSVRFREKGAAPTSRPGEPTPSPAAFRQVPGATGDSSEPGFGGPTIGNRPVRVMRSGPLAMARLLKRIGLLRIIRARLRGRRTRVTPVNAGEPSTPPAGAPARPRKGAVSHRCLSSASRTDVHIDFDVSDTSRGIRRESVVRHGLPSVLGRLRTLPPAL